MWAFLKAGDGSVFDLEGRPLYLVADRFANSVKLESNCFLCAQTINLKKVSNEHILPKWLLRRFGLFDSRVIYPNGQAVSYGRYVVPCCENCNLELSTVFEYPISQVFEGGRESVENELRTFGPSLVFGWLALIFLKVAIKDKHVRVRLDNREGDARVSDGCDWYSLHHAYCLIRTVLVGGNALQGIGSLVLLPAKSGGNHQVFDYATNLQSQSIMLKFGDFALVAVLDDACAALSILSDHHLSDIKGPLSALQLREVFAHLSYINRKLEVRPKFHSGMSKDGITIKSEFPPQTRIVDHDPREYGQVLHHAVMPILSGMVDMDCRLIEQKVLQGEWQFLYDENGEFDLTSGDPVEPGC